MVRKKKKLKAITACLDDDCIWVNDEIVNGLYIIDKLNYKMKNVLNTSQVFRHGFFHTITIFKSGDNIVMVPEKLDKPWIFFNKITGELFYKNIIESNSTTTGLHVIGRKAYLAPKQTEDPIYIIDLDTFRCINSIRNWNREIAGNYNKGLISWGSVSTETDLFFSFYNTKFVVKVNSKRVDTFFVDIPYNICNLFAYRSEVWILPINGDSLYTMDFEGNVLDIIKLNIDNNQAFSVSKYAKIVVGEKYVFLLPFYNGEIFIYDKLEKKPKPIVLKNSKKKLGNDLGIQYNMIAYWEYFIDKNSICFLPLDRKCLKINLNTMESEENDIFLPSIIENNQLDYWVEWNQFFIGDNATVEISEKSLEIWFDFVRIQNQKNTKKKLIYGKEIWMNLDRKGDEYNEYR